jgi:uncharacterized protein YbjT (DUF2867 family)
MNILLTGATGFIGRYLLADLLVAGHHVVPAVRDTRAADRLLPRPAALACDFNRDVRVEDWLPRLAGIDAVVNCAGILQGSFGQSIQAIHSAAPMALFTACEKAGVRRVIQISAISSGADTTYARSKKSADDFLAAKDLDWIVLRPSLVYAAGAYGGTALFRALAALPFAIPLIGKGDQLFRPIHMRDLTATVVYLLEAPHLRKLVIDPVGPEAMTLREILTSLRRWLGFVPARLVEVPLPLVRLAARLGDVLGGTINSTALRQLEFGNNGTVEVFTAQTGIVPHGWNGALLTEPAQLQDRWQARLYFLKPLLRWCIAATWLVSGFSGLLHRSDLVRNFTVLGFSLSPFCIWASCLLDIAISAALLARLWRRRITLLQIAVVAAYTLIVTIADPSLWLAPFGPLLKNIPFLAAILVLAALESDR